jgi:hypothetical protein
MTGWKILPWIIGYFLLFYASTFGVLFMLRKKRTRRFPLPDNTKLLRMPGEQLWRELTKSEENDDLLFIAAIVVPLIAVVIVFELIRPLVNQWPIATIVVLISTIIVSIWLTGRFMAKRFFARNDKFLGFFGERYVGEYLDKLKHEGWFVFHDVPFEGATGTFNIDHVALSGRGVWIVETKTRRKGDARPGYKDHEVLSDGTKLIWPWGEDDSPITQASRNAASLREWIKAVTNQDVKVSAVVAIPGWKVGEEKVNGVRVANPKNLYEVITTGKAQSLSEEQLDLFRRQLDQKCRDVSY